jgi:hypothetical protein
MTIAQPRTVPNTREDRAFELYRERGDEIIALGEHAFEVPSCTGRNAYEVHYGGAVESCSCPDFGFGHGIPCKHLLAVGILHASRRSGIREIRIMAAAVGDPFAHAGKRPCACLEGFVFITYEDEHGEEREASYRCRRCAEEV